MKPKRPRTLSALLLLAAASGFLYFGAADDGDAREVVARFDSWLLALRSGDLDGVRRLSTFESRAYVDALPKQKAGSLAPEVAVYRLEPGRATLRVQDRDPNAVAKDGFFVLQREDGEWRVDLVETAGRNSREVDLPGAPTRMKFIPNEELRTK